MTTVIYKDVAVGADKDAAVAVTGAASFSEPSQLPFGVWHEPIATLEPNSWRLNGTRKLRETQRVAFWSEELSGQDGVFTSPPTISVSFDKQYSALGITLVFDRATGEYCSEVNIQWLQGGVVKSDVNFYPDKVSYFCQNKVEAFDQAVITIKKTGTPQRYAKLDHILFGLNREFGMSEIRNAKISNRTSLISSEVPVSTFNWTLDSRSDVDFMFQLKQPVDVINNGNLIGVYYIDEHKRKSKNVYEVKCNDAMGVLAENNFPGGAYLSGVSAKELFLQAVGGAFDVAFEIEDTTLYGIIRPGTRRDAMQQVLFAWGAIATTDGREGIRVFSLSEAMKEIGAGSTYTGVSVSVSSIVTEVRVTAHTYTKSENGNIGIGDTKYSDTETVYTISNPNVTATDKQNVVEVKDATLVSVHNGQSVAQRVYDYYLMRNTNKAKIVWNGELLGDYVSVPNSWGGKTFGHVSQMDIAISNTVAAQVETIGL